MALGKQYENTKNRELFLAVYECMIRNGFITVQLMKKMFFYKKDEN